MTPHPKRARPSSKAKKSNNKKRRMGGGAGVASVVTPGGSGNGHDGAAGAKAAAITAAAMDRPGTANADDGTNNVAPPVVPVVTAPSLRPPLGPPPRPYSSSASERTSAPAEAATTTTTTTKAAVVVVPDSIGHDTGVAGRRSAAPALKGKESPDFSQGSKPVIATPHQNQNQRQQQRQQQQQQEQVEQEHAVDDDNKKDIRSKITVSITLWLFVVTVALFWTCVVLIALRLQAGMELETLRSQIMAVADTNGTAAITAGNASTDAVAAAAATVASARREFESRERMLQSKVDELREAHEEAGRDFFERLTEAEHRSFAARRRSKKVLLALQRRYENQLRQLRRSLQQCGDEKELQQSADAAAAEENLRSRVRELEEDIATAKAQLASAEDAAQESSYCQDANEECPRWAEEDQCNENTRFMYRNCRRSCNVCSPVPLDG